MSIRLYAEFVNLRDVRGRFSSLTDKVADRIEDMTRRATLKAVDALQRRAPRNQYPRPDARPGERLAKNIRLLAIRRDGNSTEGQIVLPDVAKYTLPPGTRPHIIRGTSKPLYFYWHKIGAMATFWSVNHPGYRPTENWREKALEEVRDDVRKELARAGRITVFSIGAE